MKSELIAKGQFVYKANKYEHELCGKCHEAECEWCGYSNVDCSCDQKPDVEALNN